MNFVYAEYERKTYLLGAHPDVRYASQLHKTMAVLHNRARIFGAKGPNMAWRADGRLGPYEFAQVYWRNATPSVDLRPGEWLSDRLHPANGAQR